MDKNRLLLVTRDSKAQSSVGAVLAANERFGPFEECVDLKALAARLDGTPGGAALVDIDPAPGEILAELERTVPRFDGTRFVVLSSVLKDDIVFDAMQAGACHFLLKDSITSKLESVLERILLPDRKGKSGQGSLTTVLSVSGGCGSTTIAVNLAHEMQLASDQSVLLVDLDPAYGAVASYLDIRGNYSVADVLSSERIDPELIRSTAVPYSEKLGVLTSPASVSFTDPLPLSYETLESTVETCRQGYSHVVIDAPRISMDTAVTLARASNVVFVVFQLTVKDVRMAKTICAALRERGVEHDHLVGLANRFRRRHQMISLPEARSALSGVHIETVSNDFRNSMRAVNYGQPLAMIAPRSALRLDLETQGKHLVLNEEKQRQGP